ncbi:MAG TPA: S8 family serine peptidase [Vicinamibacterales bacterium]|nr:S8 family serine peptidase [Vicinamibacterales bacterium]
MWFTLSVRSFFSGCLAVALVALTSSTASAQVNGRLGNKLDSILRYRATQLSGRSRVIVQFKGDADVRVFGRGVVGRRLDRGAQVGEVDNIVLATVASDPRVERVMIDRPAFATMERTGQAIGATLARSQYGISGKGVGVAIIDSGITTWHDDLYRSASGNLSRRVVHFKDFTRDVSPNLWFNDLPSDDYGHGTHVAGIIAGSGFDSNGRRMGVAPGAKLLGLKVLDGEGHGYVSDVIAAIDYAISVRSTYNVRVINLSVASGVFESYWNDPLTLAAKRAAEGGIIVVAAAGNLGVDANGRPQWGAITAPGNAPWVLTVGASSHQGTVHRSDDTVANFSSHGPTWLDFAAKPDIVAPGVGIESLSDPRSALYGLLKPYLLNGTIPVGYKPYLSLSGTSMATPVVAGTVALMLEANPNLTPNAVKAILQFTAESHAGENVLSQGAGFLNAKGAVRLAKFFAAPQNGIGYMRDTIDGERINWARHIVWGNYLIAGGVPLPGSNAWATNQTWGAVKTQTGQPVVWGARQDDNNIVWSVNEDGNIVWSVSDDGNIVWSVNGDDNIVWSVDTDSNIVWSVNDDGNIVWSVSDDGNIVWSVNDDGNIVWSVNDDANIVWSVSVLQNVVWGTDCGGADCKKAVWGSTRGGQVVGTAEPDSNIVWSVNGDDNIVWSVNEDGNIVWSVNDDSNIVWSVNDDSNIVWSVSTVAQVLWPAASF